VRRARLLSAGGRTDGKLKKLTARTAGGRQTEENERLFPRIVI